MAQIDNEKIDNKKRAPAWLSIVSFLVYSSFFLFLMYKYGYSKTDTSWIRELNYTIIQISFITLIVFDATDKLLNKNAKYFFVFDFMHRTVSGCIAGMCIAFPLFIIMLFKF